MWSMMNLMDTSLRVPLIIRPAPASSFGNVDRPLVVTSQDDDDNDDDNDDDDAVQVYRHPVELVDLFPTLVSLAGISSENCPLYCSCSMFCMLSVLMAIFVVVAVPYQRTHDSTQRPSRCGLDPGAHSRLRQTTERRCFFSNHALLQLHPRLPYRPR